MEEYFIVEKGKKIGDNWFMCFGDYYDGEKYAVCTNHICASEMTQYIRDAKQDAELVCKLLNMYFNGLIDLKKTENV